MNTFPIGIKNLIVLCDETPDCEPRLDTALTMARKFDARLVGVYPQKLDSKCLSPEYLNQLPQTLQASISENMTQFMDTVARTARDLFERKVRSAGWEEKSRWRQINGSPNTVASVVSRFADLVVCGQNDRKGIREFQALDPGEVVAVSGRPVFVVPRDYTPKGYSAHVLLGWNGSREASRAISDAMMILDTGTRVTIATVGPADDMPESFGFDMVIRLSNWGLETRQVEIDPVDGDCGLALVRYARENQVDLIVMGAYSQSRLRQRVFGGATQSVLKQMAAPVFLSH